MMPIKRGEIWRARWEDQRRTVVVLSYDGSEGVKAFLIVPPATSDLAGMAAEVHLGTDDGLDSAGVVRAAFPRPGRVLCNWLVTLPVVHFIERLGALQPPKLAAMDELLRRAELE